MYIYINICIYIYILCISGADGCGEMMDLSGTR